MTRPRSGIGSELLPVALILVCLTGTWFLIVSMYRRGAIERAPVAIAPPVESPQPPRPKPRPLLPPPEDPTKKVLERLTLAQAEQVLETQLIDRRAEDQETAGRTALADAERWKQQEVLMRSQLDGQAEQAQRIESEADALALERDVLARERDAAKAALAKSRTRTSYAVLPHKGPNGTWRRPIIIECRNGMAKLQPNGPSFSLVDMEGSVSMHSAPLLAAVARELFKVQSTSTPDGAPAVPYIFFLIRPDGIRPYYTARGRLEPLGIAFGYELVEQDWDIDFPDLDNSDEWDGSGPRPIGGDSATTATAKPASPVGRPAESFLWPARSGGGAGGPDQDELGSRPGQGSGRGTGGGRFGASASPNLASDGLGNGGSGVDPIGGSGQPGGTPGNSPAGPSGFGQGPGGMPGGGGAGTGRIGGGGLAGLSPVSGAGMPNLEAASGSADGDGPGGSGSVPGTGQGGGSQGGSNGAGAGGGSTASGADPGNFAWPSRNRATRAGDPGPLGLGPPATPRFPSSGGRIANGSGSGTNPADPGGASTGSGNESGAGPTSGSVPSGSGGDGNAASGGSPSQGGSTGSSGGSSGGSGGGGTGTPGAVPVPLPSDGGGASGGGFHLPGRLGGPERKPLRVEVPFEIVVACGPDGVVIHPGGYRLTPKALKTKDQILVKELKSIVRVRQQVDPMIRPKPSIRFLIEPGGNETYMEARRQSLLSGIDWPVALQVGDTSVLGPLARETF